MSLPAVDTRTGLRRLLKLSKGLIEERDLDAVLGHVLEAARELTGARYAALGILDEDKARLQRFISIGVDAETRRRIGPLPRGHGILGELIRDPRPLRLDRIGEHPRSFGFPYGHPPMETFLGVPITLRGEAWGNLYLTEAPNGFSQDDEDLVGALAECAAAADATPPPMTAGAGPDTVAT